MGRKLNIDKDTLLGLRDDGLSNKAIAKHLGISVATVQRYIGPQGRRMFNFAEPKPAKKTEPEGSTLRVVRWVVGGARFMYTVEGGLVTIADPINEVELVLAAGEIDTLLIELAELKNTLLLKEAQT